MKKILIILLICGIPALGVFLYYNRVSSDTLSGKQKQEAVQKILGRGIRQERTHTLATYTGNYISFSYPAWVAVDTRDDQTLKKKPTILDFFELRNPDSHLFIVTQVEKADVSRLENETAVHLRQVEQKELYNQSTVTIDGHSGLLFTKKQDGAEKSLFIIYNGRLYSVAATALSMEAIDEVMDQILKTVKIQ